MRKITTFVILSILLSLSFGCESEEKIKIFHQNVDFGGNLFTQYTPNDTILLIKSKSELLTSVKNREDLLGFDDEFFMLYNLLIGNFKTSTSGGSLIDLKITGEDDTLLVSFIAYFGLLDALGSVDYYFSVSKKQTNLYTNVRQEILFDYSVF